MSELSTGRRWGLKGRKRPPHRVPFYTRLSVKLSFGAGCACGGGGRGLYVAREMRALQRTPL